MQFEVSSPSTRRQVWQRQPRVTMPDHPRIGNMPRPSELPSATEMGRVPTGRCGVICQLVAAVSRVTRRRQGMLVVISGLPGTGKSTIAKAFVAKHSAAYVRVDEIENAVRSPTMKLAR